MPEQPESSHGFVLVRRRPGLPLAGLVTDLVGYRETMPCLRRQREVASLTVPIIVNLGTPFLIAYGREPLPQDRQESFAAGVHDGLVEIRSDGAAECLQIDFTPLGAYRIFGGALAELSSRMVDLDALFGAAGGRLRQRLWEEPVWDRRFDLLEAFLGRRLRFSPSPEVAWAYRALVAAAESPRVAAVAAEIGWSRKSLSRRFRAEVGAGPKTVARLARFGRACRLTQESGLSWAAIAHGCGYADQAHLVREFGDFAGEPPTAWAATMAARDPRLRRLAADTAG